MSDDAKCKASTPAATLEQHITDSNVPKNEAEWWAYDEITRLREENARLLKENSELIVRAHALLWHLPPEITCGELQKARDEMFAATIREGGENA